MGYMSQEERERSLFEYLKEHQGNIWKRTVYRVAQDFKKEFGSIDKFLLFLQELEQKKYIKCVGYSGIYQGRFIDFGDNVAQWRQNLGIDNIFSQSSHVVQVNAPNATNVTAAGRDISSDAINQAGGDLTITQTDAEALVALLRTILADHPQRDSVFKKMWEMLENGANLTSVVQFAASLGKMIGA